MSEDTQTKTLAVGDKVAQFEVVEVLPARNERPQYLVKDAQDGSQLVLSQVGKPSKESEPEKVKRGLERAQRVASWIRTQGVVIPKDFLYEEGCLYSVTPVIQGTPLTKFIEENNPAPNQMVVWLTELAGALEVFHDARQPQYLGRLPVENLRVTQDGRIQLTGFDMGPDFKIEFVSENAETAKAPDARLDARSDVWALASLLQKCIELSKDEVKKQFRAEKDLNSLLGLMSNADPDKRVPNMATLKTRFERLAWQKAPKLSNTGFTDAPINVYTVEEKSQFAEIAEAYRLWILIGFAGLLAFIAVMQFIFPPEI